MVKIYSNFNHTVVDFMKRIIDYYLLQWKNSPGRKPLIVRGARQVGKTFAIRRLGKTFEHFVEINLELQPEIAEIFQHNLKPERILQSITHLTSKRIEPGTTLLFFDEIQASPRALTALRYLYEEMPQLHVVAAGSLLDFAIQEVGVPVGRVSFLHMYPVSFLEFLVAQGKSAFVADILTQKFLQEPPLNSVHESVLRLVGMYLALGGMPQVLMRWEEFKDFTNCFELQTELVYAYRQDFFKYAKAHQIKYLDLIFGEMPRQLGQKFKFSAIPGEYRKRELAPALDLLATAGVCHTIMRSAGNGIPLAAQADADDFKAILLDIALTQCVLKIKPGSWFVQPLQELINKGAVVEAFIGQELLAYAYPRSKEGLFYWRKNEQGGAAEIDYLVQCDAAVIPIEVKSGTGTSLKSMKTFLQTHPRSPFGVRFSTNNYSVFENLHSYPLYAVAGMLCLEERELLMKALL